MQRMRFLVATLIIWLFFFYTIERFSSLVDITGVAYAFVPIMAALIILVPSLHRVSLGVLLTVPVLVFLVLKIMGRHEWGSAIPLTVTEVCIIALTIILARWVSNGVDEFEKAVAHITIGHPEQLPKSFATGQVEMYRELKRARHYDRPLTMMAIGVEDNSVRIALDRMVREVQQAMMKQYVLSDIAKTLCDQLEDYNIIAQQNSHFLVLLPEVASEELVTFGNRLRTTTSEKMGVTLQIGMASFPDDAVTFDSLVGKAVEEMENRWELEPHTQQLTSESYTV